MSVQFGTKAPDSLPCQIEARIERSKCSIPLFGHNNPALLGSAVIPVEQQDIVGVSFDVRRLG